MWRRERRQLKGRVVTRKERISVGNGKRIQVRANDGEIEGDGLQDNSSA